MLMILSSPAVSVSCTVSHSDSRAWLPSLLVLHISKRFISGTWQCCSYSVGYHNVISNKVSDETCLLAVWKDIQARLKGNRCVSNLRSCAFNPQISIMLTGDELIVRSLWVIFYWHLPVIPGHCLGNHTKNDGEKDGCLHFGVTRNPTNKKERRKR